MVPRGASLSITITGGVAGVWTDEGLSGGAASTVAHFFRGLEAEAGGAGMGSVAAEGAVDGGPANGNGDEWLRR